MPESIGLRKSKVGLPRHQFYGPLLVLLVALYFFLLAGKIDENPMPGQLGPAFWPRMILILLMASCGIKALEIFKGKRTEEDSFAAPRPEVDVLRLSLMIASVVAVVFFMDFLGFALANFLFLLLFMRLAGMRRPVPLLLTSLAGTVLLLYLFVKVVYLPLPKGGWLFNDFTVFLYRTLHII